MRRGNSDRAAGICKTKFPRHCPSVAFVPPYSGIDSRATQAQDNIRSHDVTRIGVRKRAHVLIGSSVIIYSYAWLGTVCSIVGTVGKIKVTNVHAYLYIL